MLPISYLYDICAGYVLLARCICSIYAALQYLRAIDSASMWCMRTIYVVFMLFYARCLCGIYVVFAWYPRTIYVLFSLFYAFLHGV